MNQRWTTLLVVIGVLSILQRNADAGVVFTSNPEGAWNYSFQQGGPGDRDPFYFSTSLDDVANATYQGMIVYNFVDGPTGMGAFGPVYDQPGSTYHVFSTFVTSATNQTIRLGLAGDDGHSLFVNGVFVAGAGFGGTEANPNAVWDLVLRADEEVLITLVGHDAYGSSWGFAITDPETYDGVTINAHSSLIPVPEPSSVLFFGTFLASAATRGYWRCQEQNRGFQNPKN